MHVSLVKTLIYKGTVENIINCQTIDGLISNN